MQAKQDKRAQSNNQKRPKHRYQQHSAKRDNTKLPYFKEQKAEGPLQQQLAKLYKTTNAKSINTRRDNFRRADRAARFFQEEFKVQNWKNVSNKHIAAFAKKLEAEGRSAQYIENVLSGVRFVHAMLPDVKYDLSRNNKDFIEKVHKRVDGTNKMWTKEELNKFCEVAIKQGKSDYATIAKFSYETGTRIEEVSTLVYSQAKEAISIGTINKDSLNKGSLKVASETSKNPKQTMEIWNTKGGRERDLTITPLAKELMQDWIKRVSPGQKLFVPEWQKTHRYINNLQQFINRHRDKFETIEGKEIRDGEPLVFHGLRYSFAQNKYETCIGSGMSDESARQTVCDALGHGENRKDIQWIYLGKNGE